MRLINAKTLKLEEFSEAWNPRYAILSHRWGNDEVSIHDMRAGTGKRKHGFSKIANACKQTLKDCLTHIWVDTCCIDKSSSAELSEAINSMFKWYKDAKVCYAYLDDVGSRSRSFARICEYTELLSPETNTMETRDLNDSEVKDLKLSGFAGSKWFTRGWTLQELIAPTEVVFFASDWTFIGKRTYLASVLHYITGIDEDIFVRNWRLYTVCVARKMSWAANRHTTRAEDIAYCLLGVFDINMPLIYGEGAHKAFIRLQEEIIRTTNDHTIFAWNGEDGTPNDLLAPSPKYFATARKIVHWKSAGIEEAFTMNNTSLNIRLPILKLADGRVSAILGGRYEDDFRGPICLKLTTIKLTTIKSDGKFECYLKDGSPEIADMSQVSIAQNRDISILRDPFGLLLRRHMMKESRSNMWFWVRWKSPDKWPPFIIRNAYPSFCWNTRTAAMWARSREHITGAVQLAGNVGKDVIVAFGYDGPNSTFKSALRSPCWVRLIQHEPGMLLEEACIHAAQESSKRVVTSLQAYRSMKIEARIKPEKVMDKNIHVIHVEFEEPATDQPMDTDS